MTKRSLAPDPQTLVVATAADLATLWTALVGDGGFSRRTLWMAVLDGSGCPAPVLVPIDDLPRAPAPSDVDALSQAVTSVAEFGTVVLLVARPGLDRIGEDDRRWGEALAPLAPRWPIHLATVGSEGRCQVRPI